MEKIDLLLDAELLIVHPQEPPLKRAAVAVRGEDVVDVGALEDMAARYRPERRLSRPHGLILPGLINGHAHAAMSLFRGLADDLPLKIWLEEHMFPVEGRLTPELVALGTELACAEMIRCGTIGFVDMYMFEDSVAEVVDRVGMRAWLGEGVFDFPSPAFPSGAEALQETERLMAKWKGHSRITFTVDPHTPYTCQAELLKEAKKVADRHGAFTVIHLAETDWEDAEIRRRHGCSPAEYLDGLGLLDDRLIAVHCVALSSDDIRLLAKRGVRVAHCPESNHKLGSGIAPVPEMLRQGLTVCLGTDGAASNNDLDLMSEMDTAAKIPKGFWKDPTLVSAPQALSMCTAWAAKALHREDLGALRPGMKADLCVVDLNQVHLRPCYDPVSHVVYAARSGDAMDLMVNGRLLMENRALLTIDEAALLERLSRAIGEMGLFGAD